MDSTYSMYSGVDHLGTGGQVAPGLFAHEGRCWRMVYENPVGHESRSTEARLSRPLTSMGCRRVNSMVFRRAEEQNPSSNEAAPSD